MEGSKEPRSSRPQPLHKYMHQRNPYKIRPSFKKLAILYPEFRSHCIYDFSGKIHLDFKNPQALRALTTCLLDQDFGLKVNIPDDCLVPTLPLRMNYLLWVEDMLSLIYPRSSEEGKHHSVIGLDIGTGATCVYPLLGAKQFGWLFVATESDEQNFKSAKENVKQNSLENLIILKNTNKFFDILEDEDVSTFIKEIAINSHSIKDESSQPSILKSDANLSVNDKNIVKSSTAGNGKLPDKTYLIDFTMCNPPFFSSEEEMNTENKNKKETRSKPTSVATGSLHEKVTEGGEVAFIEKMIKMSIQCKNEIRVFTTLIGHKKNVKEVKQLVKKANPLHLTVTEFCQGRTMRWGIAWTFDPSISLEKVLSKKQMLSAKPLVLLLPRSLMSQYTVLAAWRRVASWLKELKIKPRIFKSNKYFVGATIKVYKATWLNQRKKRREDNQKLKDCSMSCSDMEKQEAEDFKRKSENDHDTPTKRPKTINTNDGGNSAELNISNNNIEIKSKLDKSDELICEDNEQNNPHTNDDVQEKNVSQVVNKEIDLTDTSKLGSIPSFKKAGPEHILMCSLQIKQTQASISLEMTLLGGSKGKDAMNQLLQYLKNKLKSGT